MLRICRYLHKRALESRYYATVNAANSTQGLNFDKLIAFRRSQAKRTVLIQILDKRGDLLKSDDALSTFFVHFNNHLFNQCNLNVSSIYHFRNTIKKKDYALVEFLNEREVSFVLEKLAGDFISSTIPIRTRMICFYPKGGIKQSMHQRSSTFNLNINQDLTLVEASQAGLKKTLSGFRTLHEQILYMGHYSAMNDFSYRLKFFLASYFEDILKQTFPSAICLPFGSTLNGFGTLRSDLDIVVDLNSIFSEMIRNQDPMFFFQTKMLNSQQRFDDRSLSLTNLDLIAHILKHYLPDFNRIAYISNARVPIVKGEYTGISPPIEFDISNSDITSYLMTRLLWSYSVLNPTIVQPLVRLVKQWTRLTNLTTQSPPNNLSSFQATLLMLIFLTHEKLVPDINQIIYDYDDLVTGSKKKKKEEPKVTKSVIVNDFFEESVNQEGGDATDAEKFRFNDLNLLLDCRLNNKGKRLNELFLKFLKFYRDFDYKTKLTLSLQLDKKILNNTSTNGIYVCNPFSLKTNALESIRGMKLQRFISACTRTIEVIESNKSSAVNLIELFESAALGKRDSVVEKNVNANHDEDMMDHIVDKNSKFL